MRWKVKQFLENHHCTPYALWKASGLSRTTVYAIANEQLIGVELETLTKVIAGLEKLTNKRVEVGDVLEVDRT